MPQEPVTSPPDGIALRCEGISKWFGAVHALVDVSLSVHAGEVVALVGDNGAGKSTMIKILSGLQQPDTGQIWLGGEPLDHLTAARARKLGIETVHQHLALCDNLTAIENVVLGQEPVRVGWGPVHFLNKREAIRHARQRLDSLGIRIPDLDSSVRRLSGGQRQAIVIARALLHAHRLMMLDEPTAALGVRQTQATLDMIRSIAGQGLGVLLVSHSIDDVFAVADRVVVLRLGEVMHDTAVADTSQVEVIARITGASTG
jgi:D-xylose transport system ATP-binding protein